MLIFHLLSRNDCLACCWLLLMRASFTHRRTKKIKVSALFYPTLESRVSRLFFLFPIFVFLGAPRRLRTSWSRISACEDAYDAVEGEAEFEFDFFIHIHDFFSKEKCLDDIYWDFFRSHGRDKFRSVSLRLSNKFKLWTPQNLLSDANLVYRLKFP